MLPFPGAPFTQKPQGLSLPTAGTRHPATAPELRASQVGRHAPEHLTKLLPGDGPRQKPGEVGEVSGFFCVFVVCFFWGGMSLDSFWISFWMIFGGWLVVMVIFDGFGWLWLVCFGWFVLVGLAGSVNFGLVVVCFRLVYIEELCCFFQQGGLPRQTFG